MRCGFVAVIGAPNAGKSTLVNALVGSKVAIVSPKVQTTRMTVRGVAIKDDAQIVFVDTPGIFRPRRRFDRAMIKAAWTGAGDADAVILIVDAQDVTAKSDGLAARDTAAIIEKLETGNRKIALLLNKIDAMKREALLPLAERLNQSAKFAAIFMVSAVNGDGLPDVMRWCVDNVPEGPWLYAADQAADIPSRLLAAEITREKIFARLHDELPYATTVRTEAWEERKDGSVKIDQTIYVQRVGQKAIALGQAGRTIKEIGAASRADLEQILGRRVHLFLFVKVREDWPEAREHYDELGLEYPEDDGRSTC